MASRRDGPVAHFNVRDTGSTERLDEIGTADVTATLEPHFDDRGLKENDCHLALRLSSVEVRVIGHAGSPTFSEVASGPRRRGAAR